MMPINWLNRLNHSFLDLVPIIDKAAAKQDSLLETSFVSSLLDVFWDVYKNRIMWEQFIPFFIYQCAMINFMMFSLQPDIKNTAKYHMWFYPLCGAVIVFIYN